MIDDKMELLAEFTAHLRTVKNYSPHTLQAYASDLEAFAIYTAATFDFQPLSRRGVQLLTHPMIRAWASSLGLSRASLSRKLSSIRAYLRFCHQRGYVPGNPALRVLLPKQPRKLPAFAREAELQQLLNETIWPKGLTGARDRAVLELLYGCGLRRAELISLKTKSVDKAGMTLRVLGKGSKERLVPFGKPVLAALQAYEAAKIEAGIAYGETLFQTEKGERFYPRLVHRIVESYLSRLGTLAKASPHVLRHTYATHLVDRGADLNAVKELLGHKSLAATQVYVHNSIQKLKESHRKAHPKSEK